MKENVIDRSCNTHGKNRNYRKFLRESQKERDQQKEVQMSGEKC